MTGEHRGSWSDDGWSGALDDFLMASSARDGDLAATVVVGPGGQARGWLNLRLVPIEDRGLVWLWARAQAAHHPPLSLLWMSELAALRLLHEQEAG